VQKLRESVTISLTKELKEKLDKIAKDEKVNRSDIVKSALKQYLSIIEFRKIRSKMLLKAEMSGIYDEEDVYKIIS
jgi:metal-responsive CopG/Arc/MetJ family transcriptional regulator